MAVGNFKAEQPGAVCGSDQHPLYRKWRANLPDWNEDEEPGTVLSCVIADAGTKNKCGHGKAEMQDVKTIVSRSRISAF